MKARCDKCNEEFDTEEVKVKERKVNDFTEQYFNCPKCGEHYHISYMDRECFKIQNRIKQLRQQIVKEQIKLKERMAIINEK